MYVNASSPTCSLAVSSFFFPFDVLLIGGTWNIFLVQADSETDEVYAQMTLQPVNKVCEHYF